jgi:hypothetical protein
MPLNRLATLRYAQDYWMTPCDDGFFYSYTAGGGRVVIREVHNRLRRQGKLPDPDNWQAVFLPDLPRGGLGERACFIRPNPQAPILFEQHRVVVAGVELEDSFIPPPELSGRFDVVPFHEDHGLVDCAHFISKCLSAGGIKVNHAGVPELVQTVRNLPDTMTRTLGLKVTRERGDRIMDSGIMRPGDLIAYWKPIEFLGTIGYGHSAIYVGIDADTQQDPESLLNQGPRQGRHRITCHTVSRFGTAFYDDSWYLQQGPGHSYTLIHFVDPEDAIPTETANLLKDWLAVDHAGRTEYYRLHGNGNCEKSTQAPKPGKPARILPNDHGYWFVRRDEVFTFWPQLGQVDQFDLTELAAGDGGMSGTVNEHSAVGKPMK